MDKFFYDFIMGSPEAARFFPNHCYLSNTGKRYYARQTAMQYYIGKNILICQEILGDAPMLPCTDVVVSMAKRLFSTINGYEFVQISAGRFTTAVPNEYLGRCIHREVIFSEELLR